MFRLVYVSTRTQQFPDADLPTACKRFQDFNTSHDITGLLLVGELNFMQVLEGPEADIRALYERIFNDNRHSNVQRVFEETEAASRCFPHWSMRWLPAPLRKAELPEILPATAPSRIAELVSNFGL